MVAMGITLIICVTILLLVLMSSNKTDTNDQTKNDQ